METRVITFPSVFHAMKAEKILKNQGVPVNLIPIPRELSGSCEGLAAKLATQDVEKALALLDAVGIEMIQRGIKLRK